MQFLNETWWNPDHPLMPCYLLLEVPNQTGTLDPCIRRTGSRSTAKLLDRLGSASEHPRLCYR